MPIGLFFATESQIIKKYFRVIQSVVFILYPTIRRSREINSFVSQFVTKYTLHMSEMPSSLHLTKNFNDRSRLRIHSFYFIFGS